MSDPRIPRQKQNFSVDTDLMRRSRYVRLSIGLDENDEDGKPPLEDFGFDAIPPDIFLETELSPINHRSKLGKSDYCIYCGSDAYEPQSSRPLGDEHVIPEALGSRLYFETACCKSCEGLINSYEGKLSSHLLWGPRKKLGLNGKKRKRSERKFIVNAEIRGKNIQFDLPIDQNPVFLLMPKYLKPGILDPWRNEPPHVAGLWCSALNSFQKVRHNLKKQGYERISTTGVDVLGFAQTISKIAYGYAAAKIGFSVKPDGKSAYFDGFRSDLPSYILKKYASGETDSSISNLVGGTLENFEPSDHLHQIGIGVVESFVSNYLVVNIRLFSNLGAPIYTVVVGEKPLFDQKGIF